MHVNKAVYINHLMTIYISSQNESRVDVRLDTFIYNHVYDRQVWLIDACYQYYDSLLIVKCCKED